MPRSKKQKVAPKAEEEKDEARPWASWPTELPKANEAVPECKEYKFLEDDTFVRDMNLEIRTTVLDKCISTFERTEGAGVLLAGGTQKHFMLYDSDTTICPFRQEAYFRYVFSVNEPGCFGALDLTRKESILFVPEHNEDYEKWEGKRRPLAYYKEKYAVDHVLYTHELEVELGRRGISHLYILQGVNTDSKQVTDVSEIMNLKGVQLGKFSLDKEQLHPLLSEMRVYKTDKEIEYMRMANLVSSQAHVYVMRHIKPGMTERQLEALFKAWISFFGGSRHLAYTCICACGPNGSTLHYGHAGRPNDRVLEDGDTALLDMGGEYRGYASDITCSYPVNGVFSDDQRAIYNAVRAAQEVVFNMAKPGVLWTDCHKAAEREILTHLCELGLLTATVDECIEAKMGAVFMPHGLGHFIGLNTHDVGGYNGAERSKEPGLCWLRTTRMLKKGMCITVEPGCYFGDPVLDKALANPEIKKLINEGVLQRFRGFGGIRLEDNIVITPDGCMNLTVVPKSAEEIENIMMYAQKGVPS